VDGEGDVDLVSVQLRVHWSVQDAVAVSECVWALVVLQVVLAVGDQVPVVDTCPDVVEDALGVSVRVTLGV